VRFEETVEAAGGRVLLASQPLSEPAAEAYGPEVRVVLPALQARLRAPVLVEPPEATFREELMFDGPGHPEVVGRRIMTDRLIRAMCDNPELELSCTASP
jgi:hypothetical protein